MSASPSLCELLRQQAKILESIAGALEQVAPSGRSDEIVAVAALVKAEGHERKGLDTLIASGELPARRIGRRVFVRRSDLLALIPARTTMPPAVPPVRKPARHDDFARVVELESRRAR